jgi:hypothetical protein
VNNFSNLPWPDDEDRGESDCGSPRGLPRPWVTNSAIRRVDELFDRLRAEMFAPTEPANTRWVSLW